MQGYAFSRSDASNTVRLRIGWERALFSRLLNGLSIRPNSFQVHSEQVVVAYESPGKGKRRSCRPLGNRETDTSRFCQDGKVRQCLSFNIAVDRTL